MKNSPQCWRSRTRGGLLLGLLLGVVLGALVVLGVIWFIDRAPPPTFAKDTLQNSSLQQERARNQNWDPNAALYGGNPAQGTARVGAAGMQEGATPSSAEVVLDRGSDAAAGSAAADPIAAIAAAATPGETAAASVAATDGYQYFVQVGAYRFLDDAHAQRAKILMLGWDPRVTEREENGSPIYRVRLGPFAKRGDAEQPIAQLNGAGIATSLVRVKTRE